MTDWWIALLIVGGVVGSFIMIDVWIHKEADNYGLQQKASIKDIERLLAGLKFDYHNSEHHKKTQAMKRYKEKQK
jgi:hypothetical protein